MGFTLDSRLWGGLPRKGSSSPLHLTLRVAYFNRGDGASFNVSYDSVGGGCRTLEELHTDDSGRWSVYETTVSDGAFGKGCTVGQASVEASGEGADIVLSSTSHKADAIVQSIEIFDKNFAVA